MKLNHIYNLPFEDLELPPSSIDLVVTSPPYWNTKSNIHWPTYDSYLESTRTWLIKLRDAVKPGRTICWNTQILPAGSAGIVPIPHDVAFIARQVGLLVRDEIIWEGTYGYFKAPIGSFPYPPSIPIGIALCCMGVG